MTLINVSANPEQIIKIDVQIKKLWHFKEKIY